MIITETGILVSTDPNMRDPAPLNFKIEGGQVGDNSVRATGLTGDTTYYAQSYFVRDGMYIRQKGLTEFKTAAQEEVLKIKNAYAGNNNIAIMSYGDVTPITLSYSTDQGTTWNTWTKGASDFNTWWLPENGELWLKGNNQRISTGSAYYYFSTGKIADCEGSISALVRKDLQVVPDYCFYRLFQNTKIRTAPDTMNSIPLGQYCYAMMFYGCTQLTAAPSLPATELAAYCYNEMFENCSSLVTPPALPATTLASGCYYGMFINCTSLSSAPSLPATTLQYRCYASMFNGCSSLAAAPALPATGTLPNGCYASMFRGCSSLTSAPALPATALGYQSYSQMFASCTSLTTAPELPATTLDQESYNAMFEGCTALTQAPTELPSARSSSGTYSYMFSGCTSLTTAPIVYGFGYGSASGMFNGCTSLNKIICYATGWNTNTTYNWVQNVAESGDFYNLGGATIPIDNNSGVPIGWTVHTYLGDPLRLTNTANETNTISLVKFNIPNITLEYSTDGINWTTNGPTDGAVSVTLQPHEYIMFRGINGNFNTESKYLHFASTAACEVSGDINTLLNKVGGDIQLPPNPTFYKLFAGMTYLENGGLVLPSTTAGNSCYEYMFDGCTSLTQAPALPATTLAVYCYECMFRNCTSLTTAPALPATVLTRSCYYQMFSGCTALTDAPDLPATTLAQNCYYGMFYGCTSLETAPTLPASTLAQECYTAMFRNCSSLNNIKVYATTWNTSYTNYWVDGVATTGDFYNIGGATIPSGIKGIPTSWTVHTSL